MALVPHFCSVGLPCAPLRERPRKRHWGVAAVIGLRSLSRRASKNVFLLPDEAGAILRLPAITTVTFYEGEPCEELLRSMTHTLVKANPWLAGRLTRYTGAVTLRMDEKLSEDCGASHFESIRSHLSMDWTPLKMRRSLKPFMVKPGLLCLGKDEELFKATNFNEFQ